MNHSELADALADDLYKIATDVALSGDDWSWRDVAVWLIAEGWRPA